VTGITSRPFLQNMTEPTDKDVDQASATRTEPAGRVEFDSRGNSIWRWAKDVIDSTSILLKRLDNKDLALEPTQRVPVVGGRAEKLIGKRSELRLTDSKGRDTGGGFDPYNSRR
jgi:hypothetical protein